jgi:6-phosphogluconate dehydrogenase (decarboxylating)
MLSDQSRPLIDHDAAILGWLLELVVTLVLAGIFTGIGILATGSTPEWAVPAALVAGGAVEVIATRLLRRAQARRARGG